MIRSSDILRHLPKTKCLLFLVSSFTACSFTACARSNVVNGEKFAVHTITDPQMGGLVFVALKAPVDWQVTGEVRWKYEDVSVPVSASMRAWNPSKPEAVTFFPQLPCYWLQGAAAYNRPGSKALGQLNVQPMSPSESLRSAIVQFYHPNLPSLKIIGVREMPKLAAMLKVTPQENYTGVGMKVTYEENGQPMEEEFYALYYVFRVPYDGPQGRSIQINWGLDHVHSFKAPGGTLDKRREVMASIVHSVQINPQWTQRAEAVRAQIGQQFNQNLAQGYANIEAAGRLSRQISANSDALIASMDRQRDASNASSSASSARSSNDTFDDYVRGVDTMNDPYTGTSQHSSSEQYHWTDGYGSYANSNDASFDPNQTSNITWQQMTPAR